MSKAFGELMLFVRARWRWFRGRCPRCNRHFHAAFPYYLAGHANCPDCKDETGADLRRWWHDAWGVAERPAVGGVARTIEAKEVASMTAVAPRRPRPGQTPLNGDAARSEDRWRDDGGQG